MSDNTTYDLIVKNVRVVRPNKNAVDLLDIGIKNGKFIKLAAEISPNLAKTIFDGKNLLGFPGVIDCHMHTGIYNPLEKDAQTESRAAAQGGVTTGINYIRTGHYYLNRGGSHKTFFPEVLNLSEGNYYNDYAYHLVPMDSQHVGEMENMLTDYGVCSFKIFMFYGSHGLHGRSNTQSDYLMIGDNERYDMAHFEKIMRGLKHIGDNHPELKDYLSLSFHCETAEIMTAYQKVVEADKSLCGLKAYSASRPPHSEGMSIVIASYLADQTGFNNINLLHLSSKESMQAAMTMAKAFPHINFRREVTVSHLCLDDDCPNGNLAKVNPPIRTKEDKDYLWQQLLERKIHWVGSDHACCPKELKLDKNNPDDVFKAKAGYGGTDYLLSGVFSEGHKRGMSYNHLAELLSWNPSRRYGLLEKGDIAVGYDADLVLFDPNETFVVDAKQSESTQGYSPFDGMELTGKVKNTFLRGNLILDQGNVVGKPMGRYLRRPTKK